MVMFDFDSMRVGPIASPFGFVFCGYFDGKPEQFECRLVNDLLMSLF